MKKFRVEFNDTGFYSGAGIWETLDEYMEIEADNAQEAIDLAKDWWIESISSNYRGDDYDDVYEEAVKDTKEFAWRSSEIRYDEDGFLEDFNWEFD